MNTKDFMIKEEEFFGEEETENEEEKKQYERWSKEVAKNLTVIEIKPR